MITELYTLFAELRRLKQTELPRAEAMEPVERAMQEKRIRAAIRRAEERIEREMGGTMNEQADEEIAMRVSYGKCEPQMSQIEVAVFASWIDENGNHRCGMVGGEDA